MSKVYSVNASKSLIALRNIYMPMVRIELLLYDVILMASMSPQGVKIESILTPWSPQRGYIHPLCIEGIEEGTKRV